MSDMLNPTSARGPSLQDAIGGAVAGGVATAAMSAFMLGAQQAGFQGEQPPARIVRKGRWMPSGSTSGATRPKTCLRLRRTWASAPAKECSIGSCAGAYPCRGARCCTEQLSG